MFTSQRIDKSKKSNFIIKLFKIIIYIFIIAIIIIFIWYWNFKSNILVENETILNIKQWDKTDFIAEKLWINKYYFKTFLYLNEPDFKIMEWNYKINSNSNIELIVEWLSKPIKIWEIDITLLEWWNIYDIDEYLTKKDLINKWDYIKYATSSEKIEKLTEFYKFINWLNTLEWYLYPDTYTVDSDNFKINNLVIKQLDSFESKVYNKILSNMDNKKIEELVNLASIVEKEEKNSDEKPIVAWILKKRLNEWWMIWADATVCYPHKLTANECKMVISKYIKEISEYNTRTMSWLPKTPISNPSFDTINATLNYKETSYWFYLHDTRTWKIYYAITNEEHNVNKSNH